MLSPNNSSPSPSSMGASSSKRAPSSSNGSMSGAGDDTCESGVGCGDSSD
jgi:hypothetical protein